LFLSVAEGMENREAQIQGRFYNLRLPGVTAIPGNVDL